MATLAVEGPSAPREPGVPGRIILGVAIVAAFTILITWRAYVLEKSLQREAEQPSLVDKPAPNFSALTPEGRTVSLAEFRGKKNVVVSFWASWCAPCRLEMPALVKFYQDNHTDASDFEILAVSIDDDPKDASEFALMQKLNFPVLLDPTKKTASAYEVESIPTMFVIGKDGKVAYGHSGYDAMMEFWLKRELGIKAKKAVEGGTVGDTGH